MIFAREDDTIHLCDELYRVLPGMVPEIRFQLALGADFFMLFLLRRRNYDDTISDQSVFGYFALIFRRHCCFQENGADNMQCFAAFSAFREQEYSA